MKKLSFALVFVLLFTFLCPCFSSAAVIKDGGYIVLADENDARLEAAGETLSRYLEQITSAEFDVSSNGNGLKITLGYSSDIPDNGYCIETAENSVSITGSGTRGVIHGVYAFLEKYCGCDWYTSTLYSVPQNTEIEIPAGEKTEYTPFFEYTDTDWVSPRDVEYSLANGLNGSPYRTIPDELGGTVEYISNFCHTFGSQFCSKDKYFESNPEYFALHDGRRQNEQLCLTNEDVYNLILSEVMALLEEKHDPEKSLQIISLTQGDSSEDAKMCQCESCKAIDDANGSYAGTMITFVNRIAKEVKAAGYDNVAIDTFAYRYTRKAPLKVVPEDNVIVRLCTIECCFAHALDDEACSENAALMADLRDWSKICERIYIWDYATNYAHTLGIFPDFGVLQRNIQVFYENNVKGVYEEGNYYMNECDGEFGELRSYLLSKLMQNPYLDYEKYMNEFLESYYGKGWENIRQFIDMTVQKATPDGGHLKIYHTMDKTLGFTDEDIENADLFWENAKNEAENDTQLKNIERSEICWRYWKAFNAYDKAEIAALVEDMKALSITKINEGSTDGPDGIKFINVKASKLGNNVIFPVAAALYALTALLGFAVMIVALIKKPRKYIYILLFVLIGILFEIFAWHRRAFIAWVAPNEYILTFIIIEAVYIFAGALLTKGVKNRIFSAVLSGAVWACLYALAFFVPEYIVFNGGARELSIAAAFVLSGIQAIAMLGIMMKKLLSERKKQL